VKITTVVWYGLQRSQDTNFIPEELRFIAEGIGISHRSKKSLHSSQKRIGILKSCMPVP
jgi:hypothetical protein